MGHVHFVRIALAFFAFSVFLAGGAFCAEVTAVIEGGRFSVYGDGTVLDTETGLMWPKDADISGQPLPFHLAKKYIQEMNSGEQPNFGYSDWRLPSINEIDALAEESASYPALPPKNPFLNVQNTFYWSSSTGKDLFDYSWGLDMATGAKASIRISNCTFLYFWPVRSSLAPKASKAGSVFAAGLIGDENPGLSPVGAAGGLSDVIKISAGHEHVLALKSDGTVWAWGKNTDGRLGDGTKIGRTRPVQVKDLFNVVDIAAGMNHSVALKSDGTIWTWGKNSFGQLGDGTGNDRATPGVIKNFPGADKVFAGQYGTFAVKAGALWAWGRNSYGQLGDGTNADKSSPVEIKGISEVVKVASGMYHTAALKSDGTMWAWGWNMFGLVGDGTYIDRPFPVKIAALAGVKDVAAGFYHSLALKSDGTVWAWGKNEYSQLGSSKSSANAPVAVEGLNNVEAVAAGAYHSVSLSNEGAILIWGKDTKDNREKQFPTEIKGITGIYSIAAGKYFTAALK